MTRPVWSGAVSFGLVTIPVHAYVATRDDRPRFHRITRDTGARVRQRNIAEDTGDPVERDEIELGYEIAEGRYVRVDPDELDALRPTSSRVIEVRDFVALDEIDPVYFDRTYWLGPDGETAEAAYGLLQEAMAEEQRVGIGCFVMRRRAYVAAVRPLSGRLALTTMHFAGEVVDVEDIPEVADAAVEAGADAKALDLAHQIIDGLATDWDPERYRDTYSEDVRRLIESKDAGEEVEPAEPAEPGGGKVLDLMAALRASVDDSGGSTGSTGKKKAESSKSSSAKKSSSKSSSSKKTSAKKTPTKKSAATGKDGSSGRTKRSA